MFRTKIQVRYCETDRMGVVHHSRYFPWFEVGRTEFFKSSGMSYDQVEQQGVLLPLVDCYCKFMQGAVYGDDVWVEVTLAELGVAKCKFSYRVIRTSDETLLATGTTTHGFTSPEFKPLNLKKAYPEIYRLLDGLRGETV
ncbi:MAG: acyl-CoA thioesterase [Clostridia bacterium]|nr:acyl-CoA thioesterase [Clostridia bacterium]